MIRKIFFWAHLSAGVLTAIVILTMSVTGILLTYERQMLAWSASTHNVPKNEQTEALPLDELLSHAKAINPEFSPSSVVILNNPGAPVALQAGRAGGLKLNPFTGEEMSEPSHTMENFFRSMTSFHRWFSVSGENRNIARAITGASNLIFLFLIFSGMYLWLPRIYKWRIFKTGLLFNSNNPTSKARDYNWHHVFGIWSAIPLAIVVATALVFSYGWANNLIYQVYGEEVPVRRGPPGPPPGGGNGAQAPAPVVNSDIEYLNLDQLFASANQYVNAELGDDWRQISISMPAPASPTARISVDLGSGGQPQLQHTLNMNRVSGEVTGIESFSDRSPATQARFFIRFLHTGEALGLWGQTIAGLVSLATLFMVWTGIALSYRRLIQPILKRRKLNRK